MNKTKTHTQNFHKPLFMIVMYRKKFLFYLDHSVLGGKVEEVNARYIVYGR